MNRYKRKLAIAKAKRQAEYQSMVDRYNKHYGCNITVFDLLRMHGVNEGSMFDVKYNCKMPQYYMDPDCRLSSKLQKMADYWKLQLVADNV